MKTQEEIQLELLLLMLGREILRLERQTNIEISTAEDLLNIASKNEVKESSIAHLKLLSQTPVSEQQLLISTAKYLAFRDML